MTVSLAFMLAGVEDKLLLPEAKLSQTVDELRAEVLDLIKSRGINSAESPQQIRIIYSGKILKGKEPLDSVINQAIQPPYTMQLMIRPKGCEPEKERTPDQNFPTDQPYNETCCLLI